MTTAVSPTVQLTARQRACLEQIARRQTSSQRLVRRAKILLALETGANQCHVMRQMHLNRGTVQMWGRRWCALAPTLEPMEADEGSEKALTTRIVEALADHPRSGPPATFTAEQMVQIVAVACEDPAESGRPISHWTPREVAEEVRKRGLIETISTRSVGPSRTEEDLAVHIAHTIATDPEAPWLCIVDQLNTHKSEALVRLVASTCGIEEDLGEKEQRGIVPSMPTRAAFLSDVHHRIRFL